MIQESDLRTPILGPPRRIAVTISSGERATMYVEQDGGHWLKHDAWLRQLAAAGQPAITFHYEFVENHLAGYWRDDTSAMFPPPYDVFDVPLNASNRNSPKE
jgi:hypothetical protein